MSGLILKKDWHLFQQVIRYSFGFLAFFLILALQEIEFAYYEPTDLEIFLTISGAYFFQNLFLHGDHGTLQTSPPNQQRFQALLGACGLGYVTMAWLDLSFSACFAWSGFEIPGPVCYAGMALGIPLGFLLCNVVVSAWSRYRQAQLLAASFILVGISSILFESLGRSMEIASQTTHLRYVPGGMKIIALASFFIVPVPLFYLLIFRKSFRIESKQQSAREIKEAQARAERYD